VSALERLVVAESLPAEAVVAAEAVVV
jgi:hypothetical protein